MAKADSVLVTCFHWPAGGNESIKLLFWSPGKWSPSSKEGIRKGKGRRLVEDCHPLLSDVCQRKLTVAQTQQDTSTEDQLIDVASEPTKRLHDNELHNSLLFKYTFNLDGTTPLCVWLTLRLHQIQWRRNFIITGNKVVLLHQCI